MTKEQQLQMVQERYAQVLHGRVENLLLALLLQGTILIAVCGVAAFVFGFRKTAIVFFWLFSMALIVTPGPINVYLGVVLLGILIAKQVFGVGVPNPGPLKNEA